jgi:carbon monoxide dehydrogenase subunit G
MIEIIKNQEANAPIETVWKAISDADNEQKYWSALRNVKILSRNGNTIEREATIRRGPMGEAKSFQTLVINPAEKTTMLTMTKGPMLGTRKVALISVTKERTRIDVSWQFELKGIPGFAQGFVKDNISEVTDTALIEITAETERESSSIN